MDYRVLSRSRLISQSPREPMTPLGARQDSEADRVKWIQMDELERQPIFISNHPLVTLADSQRSYIILHLSSRNFCLWYSLFLWLISESFCSRCSLQSPYLAFLSFLDTFIFIVIREAPLAKPQTFQLLRRPGTELIKALWHYNICDFNHFTLNRSSKHWLTYRDICWYIVSMIGWRSHLTPGCAPRIASPTWSRQSSPSMTSLVSGATPDLRRNARSPSPQPILLPASAVSSSRYSRSPSPARPLVWTQPPLTPRKGSPAGSISSGPPPGAFVWGAKIQAEAGEAQRSEDQKGKET